MSNPTEKPGSLVISLDFELLWGMFDKVDSEIYGNNILGVHKVVPKILEIFCKYEVRATWAVVGMLMAESKNELSHNLPTTKPTYSNQKLSAYDYLEKMVDDTKLYFAPQLVRKIIATEGQELASHTFSHFYAKAANQETAVQAFSADCAAEKEIFTKYNTSPVSLVFPRNQVTKVALTEAIKHGLKTYRGNENSLLYSNGTESPLGIRLLRLLDSYLNLTGSHTHLVDRTSEIINVPSSRFLRPWSKQLRWLEPLKLMRIKRAMTHAAKNSEIFHLWWHPHNFGLNQKENLKNLEVILQHYQTLQKKYGMVSKNMADFIPENELPA